MLLLLDELLSIDIFYYDIDYDYDYDWDYDYEVGSSKIS